MKIAIRLLRETSTWLHTLRSTREPLLGEPMLSHPLFDGCTSSKPCDSGDKPSFGKERIDCAAAGVNLTMAATTMTQLPGGKVERE